MSTRHGETSLLKQRLPHIQRRGIAYLTSVACRTFADAWGRTLRKWSFGLKAIISSSFLSHSLSDAQVSAPTHWEKAAVFSDMVLPFGVALLVSAALIGSML